MPEDLPAYDQSEMREPDSANPLEIPVEEASIPVLRRATADALLGGEPDPGWTIHIESFRQMLRGVLQAYYGIDTIELTTEEEIAYQKDEDAADADRRRDEEVLNTALELAREDLGQGMQDDDGTLNSP